MYNKDVPDFLQLPFLTRDPKAVEIVQVILESVLLRREKTMRDRDGNRIVELPAKEVRIGGGSCMPANYLPGRCGTSGIFFCGAYDL